MLLPVYHTPCLEGSGPTSFLNWAQGAPRNRLSSSRPSLVPSHLLSLLWPNPNLRTFPKCQLGNRFPSYTPRKLFPGVRSPVILCDSPPPEICSLCRGAFSSRDLGTELFCCIISSGFGTCFINSDEIHALVRSPQSYALWWSNFRLLLWYQRDNDANFFRFWKVVVLHLMFLSLWRDSLFCSWTDLCRLRPLTRQRFFPPANSSNFLHKTVFW